MAKKMGGRPKLASFDDFVASELKDPVFRRNYELRRMVHEVAIAVRTMRETAGLTQKQLAGLIGSSQSVIARLERGRDQRAPRWDTLHRIALALGKQLRLVFARRGRHARPALVEVQDAA